MPAGGRGLLLMPAGGRGLLLMPAGGRAAPTIVRPVPELPSRPASAAPLRGFVIAIDGPSGSGKSTLARAVATRAGLRYLDTGAMYRAVTWAARQRGLDLADTDAVAAMGRGLDIDLATDPARRRVAVDGVDVTAAIRDPALSKVVSAVATNLAVRAELGARQRAVAEAGDVVLEGRDTTTVIAPDADVRVLLTADPQTRLARRAREVRGADDPVALAATHAEVMTRDAHDATVASFATAAHGVSVVDSSALSAEQVLAVVLGLIADAGHCVEPGQLAGSGQPAGSVPTGGSRR